MYKYLYALPLIASMCGDAFAQSDASYNGLFKRLSCKITTILSCNAQYCIPVFGPSITPIAALNLNMIDGTFDEGNRWKKFEIIEVARPEVNKPLLTQIKLVIEGQEQFMAIMASPQDGRYNVTSALSSTMTTKNGEEIKTISAMNCSSF